MKQHRPHVLHVLLAPRNRKRTALLVGCVDTVSMRQQLGMVTRTARCVIKAVLQTLEGMPPAKTVLQANIKPQLANLTVLPASPEVILSR